MKVTVAPFLLLALLLLLFGCAQTAQQTPPEASSAMNACISECQRQLLSNRDLSSGPCLLDPIPDFPAWVCDVAHSPRETVDNLPSNQCASFGASANHFIEASPNCKLIREV